MRRAVRTGLLAAAATAVAVASAVVGNAAQLDVDAGHLSVASVDAPCAGSAQLSPEDERGQGNSGKYDDLLVAVPAGEQCTGELQLVVLEQGRVLTTSTSQVEGGESVLLDDIAKSGFRPEDVSVVATLHGWDLPTTWSSTPPGFAEAIYPVPAPAVGPHA